MNKKLEKILAEIENIPLDNWHKVNWKDPDFPFWHYETSLGELNIKITGLTNTRIEVYGRQESGMRYTWGEDNYKEILTIDENERVNNLWHNVQSYLGDKEREREKAQQKKQKEEEIARKKRGYDGNVQKILDKLK